MAHFPTVPGSGLRIFLKTVFRQLILMDHRSWDRENHLFHPCIIVFLLSKVSPSKVIIRIINRSESSSRPGERLCDIVELLQGFMNLQGHQTLKITTTTINFPMYFFHSRNVSWGPTYNGSGCVLGIGIQWGHKTYQGPALQAAEDKQ